MLQSKSALTRSGFPLSGLTRRKQSKIKMKTWQFLWITISILCALIKRLIISKCYCSLPLTFVNIALVDRAVNCHWLHNYPSPAFVCFVDFYLVLATAASLTVTRENISLYHRSLLWDWDLHIFVHHGTKQNRQYSFSPDFPNLVQF